MQECTLSLDIELCLKLSRLAESQKMSFSDCIVFLLNGFNQPNFAQKVQPTRRRKTTRRQKKEGR